MLRWDASDDEIRAAAKGLVGDYAVVPLAADWSCFWAGADRHPRQPEEARVDLRDPSAPVRRLMRDPSDEFSMRLVEWKP